MREDYVIYAEIEFPDNSVVAQVYRAVYPRSSVFDEKYGNQWRRNLRDGVDWRGRPLRR